jgi:hypothetical protein
MHFQTKYLLYFARYQLAISAIYSQFSAYAVLISKLNSLLNSFMEKTANLKMILLTTIFYMKFLLVDRTVILMKFQKLN